MQARRHLILVAQMDRSFVAHLVGDPAADLEGEDGILVGGPGALDSGCGQCRVACSACQVLRSADKRCCKPTGDQVGIPFQAAEIGVKDADPAADIGDPLRVHGNVVPGVHHGAQHLGVALDPGGHLAGNRYRVAPSHNARAAVVGLFHPREAVEHFALEPEIGYEVIAHGAADPEPEPVVRNGFRRVCAGHLTNRHRSAHVGLRVVDEHHGDVQAEIPPALVPLVGLRAGREGRCEARRKAKRKRRRRNPAAGGFR